MSGAYSGVVVGGPMAGKMMAHMNRTFVVERQARAGYVEQHRYYFEPLGPTIGSEQHGMWIYQSLSIFEALKELINGYAASQSEASSQGRQASQPGDPHP